MRESQGQGQRLAIAAPAETDEELNKRKEEEILRKEEDDRIKADARAEKKRKAMEEAEQRKKIPGTTYKTG